MSQAILLDSLTEREQDIVRLMISGLSAREIAEELVLAYDTVRWYLKQIYSKLDVHSYDEAIARLEALNLPNVPAEHAPRHNLPTPPTSLIGRETEIDTLTHELRRPETRLLTLTGPGGIGKTRLAIQLAWHNLHHFPDGVYFVPLQPLRAVDDIPAAIIDALRLQLTSGDDVCQFLLRYVEDKQLLLVMDNFEHLLDGVNLVADILNQASDVTILATSRQTLNLQEEWVWPVGGLDIPTEDAEPQIETYSAVQLFVERARQVKPDFSLTDEQAHVLQICQLVEGMPLALELAASWVRTLPCATIAQHIAASIDFLAARATDIPARHHSIRAVFDNSWNLLSQEAQTVFSKLSVFQGGFTYDAAAQVADASVHEMAALVDHSLVRRHSNGRYDLHELLRQYGAEHLETAHQTETIRDAHCAYYATLMYEYGIDIKGRAQLDGLNAVGADLDNFRAAWLWACDHADYPHIEQMIEGFFWYRNHRSRYNEVFQQAWDRLAPAPRKEPHPVAMKTFVRINEFRHAALADIEQSLEIAREHGDQAEIAFCELLLSFALADSLTDLHAAIRLMENRLAQYSSVEEQFYVAHQYMALANACELLGQKGKSEKADQECLEQFLAIGNHILAAWMRMSRNWYEERRPNELKEILTIFQEMDVPPGQVMTLCAMSRAAWVQKQDLAQSKALAQRALEIASSINFYMGIAAALSQLSAWHSLDEDYETAIQFALRGQPYSQDTIWAPAPNLALSIAACGLGDFETVRQHFRTEYAKTMYGRWNLNLAATLMAHDGHLEKAVELLARQSPNDLTYRMEGWPLLDRLRSQLEAALGAKTYQAAWERGIHRTPDEIAHDMERYFNSE